MSDHSFEMELLRQLGDGHSIHSVCQQFQLSPEDFHSWWQKQLHRRNQDERDRVSVPVGADVSIRRDRHGIPHIQAENDADLFFGFGWAIAEDRLFQLDWLRRKASGKLSEIIGPDGLASDRLVRTIGLGHIAAAEWDQLTDPVRDLLQAFTAGINEWMNQNTDRLPIEFGLLDYRPDRWRGVDCLAIESEFRWYLTGRFPVICIPEIAQRTLGDTPLLREFLRAECDEESILHAGDFTPPAGMPVEPVGEAVNDPEGHVGSNNWVLSGARTESQLPIVASDPHIAFGAVSCWYEVHLCGGSFNVAGTSYAGIPAVMIGRNEQVAWGLTNNICSLRDLYQEKTDSEHPGCFLFDDNWERWRERTETIPVRQSDPETHTIRLSRNGPLVDALLPAPANQYGPVSLRWLGMSHGGWLTGMLGMNRATDVASFREALRPWYVPTFSMVCGDVHGHIGFHASGRIPQRETTKRGFRRGWDPADQWQGLLAFEAMPSVTDPERGWIASANNRLAPPDFPYPLAGTWTSGWRGQRNREMIEEKPTLLVSDMGTMQLDALDLHAAAAVPHLLPVIETMAPPHIQQAVTLLRNWDFRAESDSAATAIFNVFFSRWCSLVSAERFDPDSCELMQAGVFGIAARLLQADPYGWFVNDDREARIEETFAATIDYLMEECGDHLADWTWGHFHHLDLRHVLSGRGDLGQLLDYGGIGVRGDMQTVGNTGSGPLWTAATGGGYRMITDLSTSPPTLLAVDAQSQSGRPGSPWYADQLNDWLAGQFHEIPLDPEQVQRATAHHLRMTRLPTSS
ncbi:MAG: penicillin acylase family protein [Planctomycetota bacterium]|nr:penicillin acylase family protein [Planctomycetota bacterium]